jgi:hypothetical protein
MERKKSLRCQEKEADREEEKLMQLRPKSVNSGKRSNRVIPPRNFENGKKKKIAKDKRA